MAISFNARGQMKVRKVECIPSELFLKLTVSTTLPGFPNLPEQEIKLSSAQYTEFAKNHADLMDAFIVAITDAMVASGKVPQVVADAAPPMVEKDVSVIEAVIEKAKEEAVQAEREAVKVEAAAVEAAAAEVAAPAIKG